MADVKFFALHEDLTGGIGLAKDMNIPMLADFYGELLTDKQREFIDLYFNDDLSLAEIAEITGISRQGVRDVIKRAETSLTEIEDKLGLAGRYAQTQAKLDELVQCADRINEINLATSLSIEINDLCVRIKSIALGLGDT